MFMEPNDFARPDHLHDIEAAAACADAGEPRTVRMRAIYVVEVALDRDLAETELDDLIDQARLPYALSGGEWTLRPMR